MVFSHDVELVVDPFVGSRALDLAMAKVERDLDVSVAICTLESPVRRSLVSWAGIDPLSLLLASGSTAAPLTCDERGLQQGSWRAAAGALASWVAVPVTHGLTTAALWAGDRRRRWFDHDEVRHLRLVAVRVAALLDEATSIVLDELAPIELDRVLALD